MLKENETYHGFMLNKYDFLPIYNDYAALFTDLRTGLKVYYIPSSDVNKTFSITVNTPTLNKEGVKHIIEHSVLCGSRKYQTKDPFIDIKKNTMSTFMNAFTSRDHTFYIASSNNEDDFFNLFDYYLDSVFNPLCISEEKIFKGEGWHYEYDSENELLTINGVVYNEMKKSNVEKSRVMARFYLDKVFSDSTLKNDAGGDPLYIPRLSYKNFVKYYKKYYHPSNMMIFIYGDMDIKRALYTLRPFLDNYKRKVFDTTINYSSEIGAIRSFKSTYSATTYETKINEKLLKLMFKIPNVLSEKEFVILDLVTDYLNQDDSKFQLAFKDEKDNDVIRKISTCVFREKEGASLNVNVDGITIIDDAVITDIKEKVFKVLSDLFDSGIETSLFKKIVRKSRYQTFNKDTENYAFNLSDFVTKLWLRGVDPFEERYDDYYDEIQNEVNHYNDDYESQVIDHKSFIIETCKKYFNESNVYDFLFTPDKDYAKKIQSNEEKRMSKKLKTLEDNDKLYLMLEKELLSNFRLRDDTKERSCLPKLSKDMLKVDPMMAPYDEQVVSGIKVRTFDRNDDTCIIRFNFDLEGFSFQEYQYLTLVSSLLFEIDTKKYQTKKVEELEEEYFLRSCSKFAISESHTDMYQIEFLLYKEDLKEAMDFFIHFAKDVTYDDKSKIRKKIEILKTKTLQSLVKQMTQNLDVLLMSQYNKRGYINFNIASFGFIEFLNKVLSDMDSKSFDISSKLRRVSKKVYSKNRMSVTIIGNNPEVKNIMIPKIITMSRNLDRKRQEVPFEFVAQEVRASAIIMNTNVNYVGLRYGFKDADYDISQLKLNVIKKILRNSYLWDNVRLLGGAYGTSVFGSKNGSLRMVSYQDPEFTKTVKVFCDVPEYLMNLDIDIEPYIVSTFTDELSSRGALSKINRTDRKLNEGYTKDELIEELNDLLSMTLSDIHEFGKMLYQVKDDAVLTLASNEDLILANKKVFSKIYRF